MNGLITDKELKQLEREAKAKYRKTKDETWKDVFEFCSKEWIVGQTNKGMFTSGVSHSTKLSWARWLMQNQFEWKDIREYLLHTVNWVTGDVFCFSYNASVRADILKLAYSNNDHSLSKILLSLLCCTTRTLRALFMTKCLND